MRIGFHHFIFVLLLLTTSCQVTETIHFNENGSGTITVEMLRIEQSYQQLAGEEYNKGEEMRGKSGVRARCVVAANRVRVRRGEDVFVAGP